MSEKKNTVSIGSILLLTTLVALTVAIAISLGFFSKGVVVTQIPVVVAKDYLDFSTELTSKHVEVKRMAFSSPPDGAASELSEVVGKIATVRLARGQIIFLRDITSDTSMFDGTVGNHNMEVVPVLIDVESKNFDSVRVGEFVSLSKSGEKILSSVRVYEIDSQNNILKLLVPSDQSRKLTSSSNRKFETSSNVEEKWSGYLVEREKSAGANNERQKERGAQFLD